MLLAAKQDFARLSLPMFGQSFPVYPLTLSFGGEAESEDGKADVIDVKGEGDFAARLFVDRKTHLPLMMSWMDREPIVRTMTQRGGPGGGTVTAGGGTVTSSGSDKLTPEEREKLAKEAADKARQAEANRKLVEFRLYFADYKAVDGVKLPHRLQRSIDGKPSEELTFEKVRLNQKIDPKKFQVSK
jgi:hypothetical protein